jgi:hemolysin activation/secretion protein
MPDRWGTTRLDASVNVAFRHIVTDSEEFEAKRYKGRGNYIYAMGGAERLQKLPAGFSLFLKGDGQVSDQPLIPSEQYIAGGMESVRGYKENEEAGDNALHCTVELWAPDLADGLGIGEKAAFIPYLFYDRALLRLHDPLPGQCKCSTIHGAGAGVRGTLTRFLDYAFDWGVALAETDRTEEGENRFYFKVNAHF